MKKFLVLTMMIATIKAFGIFGFGIHAGVDNTSVDALTLENFTVPVAGAEYTYSLTRDEISSPFALGGQIYLDIPLVPIGFEAGFEAAWQSYRWTGDESLTAPVGSVLTDIPLDYIGYKPGDNGYSEEFTFARMSTDITAKWYLFGFPPVVKTVSVYVGGGVGLYFISPLVSGEMIVGEADTYTVSPTNGVEVDIDELVKKNTTFGYHFVAGVRIKPPVIPLAFNVDYKYTSTKENDYGDPTNTFGVIKGSVSLYF